MSYAGKGKLLSVFIPAQLDDAQLTAAEFRVLCHIARRAGKHESFCGLRSIAKVCRLNVKTVRQCLNRLVQWDMLAREKRVGGTSRYHIMPLSGWKAPLPKEPTPKTGHAPLPNRATLPLPKEATKGIPIKVAAVAAHRGVVFNWEMASSWLEEKNKQGADFTEGETRSAFLALEANGWKWGRNPVVDPHAALERQILSDGNRHSPNKRVLRPEDKQVKENINVPITNF